MEPEILALVIIGAALSLYALLGGADFGAGIWEFNSAFRSTDRERALIQRAVGPVWEANHVWLVFALVVSHSTFPIAFRAISQALWLPLLLALAGIVFRGVGFVFRAYASGSRTQQSFWGCAFALASTTAPFFFGACIGAIASGSLELDPSGRFVGNYLTGWIQPLAIFTAFFAVGVCAYLSAVYFTREAHRIGDAELTKLWRRRAIASGVWMGILAFSGLLFLAVETPELWRDLSAGWVTIACSVSAGTLSLWFLFKSRFVGAILGAATAVLSVMVDWMLAQYPYLLPPTVTVEMAKGPDQVIWATVVTALAGALMLIPALAYLFYLFKWSSEDSSPAT
jgi:cytochrome d ubiquinol oxidase subunit II